MSLIPNRTAGIAILRMFKRRIAPVNLHSNGGSMYFLLLITLKSPPHRSPIRFHPAPCIEIRDSRDVNFFLFSSFFLLDVSFNFLFSLSLILVRHLKN